MLVQPKIKCHCDNCSLDYWMFNNRENICSCLSNLNYILRINGAVVPLNGLFVSRFSRECSRYLQNSAESQKTISRNRCRKIRRSSVQPWSTLLIVSHLTSVRTSKFPKPQLSREKYERIVINLYERISRKFLSEVFRFSVDAYLFQVILVFYICQEALSNDLWQFLSFPTLSADCWHYWICTCIWCSILRRTVCL